MSTCDHQMLPSESDRLECEISKKIEEITGFRYSWELSDLIGKLIDAKIEAAFAAREEAEAAD